MAIIGLINKNVNIEAVLFEKGKAMKTRASGVGEHKNCFVLFKSAY
jgi:hypothetical protein